MKYTDLCLCCQFAKKWRALPNNGEIPPLFRVNHLQRERDISGRKMGLPATTPNATCGEMLSCAESHVLCGGDDSGSRETLCQERRPHCGQRINQRGSPTALYRIPPNSQTERAQPHEQRTIHKRESASIASIQRPGRSAAKNFWAELIELIAVFPFLLCDFCAEWT